MSVEGQVIARLMQEIPGEQLPLVIARAAAALRAEGIDVTRRALTMILQLPSMQAWKMLLTTDEERIDELYDLLRHARSEAERTKLLYELRNLQQIEADRLIAEADARTTFRPDEARRAVAEAHRLIAQHAAALDDTPTKHQD